MLEEKSTKPKLPKVPEFASLQELIDWTAKLKPVVRNALVKEITEATEKLIKV